MNKKQKKVFIRIIIATCIDHYTVIASGRWICEICTVYDSVSGDRL